MWETLPKESGSTFEDKYRITNQIFGRKHAGRNFDNYKECWLYLQDVPKFANFATKHHAHPSNKKKKRDNSDNNGDNVSDERDATATHQRPVGSKQAKRLKEEQEFIERTTEALGRHFGLQEQSFGLSDHFQKCMADFVEAMSQNMALQNMQGADPATVEEYKTALACTNLRKLQESAREQNEEAEDNCD